MSSISDGLKKELEYVVPQLRHWALKLECDEYDADGLVPHRDPVHGASGGLRPVAGPSRPPLHLAPDRARDFKKRLQPHYMKDFQAYLGTMSDLREPESTTVRSSSGNSSEDERHMGDMPPRVSRSSASSSSTGRTTRNRQALGTSVANAKSASTVGASSCRVIWYRPKEGYMGRIFFGVGYVPLLAAIGSALIPNRRPGASYDRARLLCGNWSPWRGRSVRHNLLVGKNYPMVTRYFIFNEWNLIQ